MGNANPTPANAPLGDAIAVFTPINDPLLSSNGPPELPGVDGGVRLDDARDGAAGGGAGNLATHAGDDAGGERVVQTERVADREHFLANLYGARPSERQRAELTSQLRDFQHGDVLILVPPQHFRRALLRVALELHRHLVGAAHDVEVGHDVPFIVPHEPRSRADRNFRRVERVRRRASQLLVGDERHGGRVPLEQRHRRRLLGVERGARARG
jgi:hypothetical protein